MPQTRLTRQLSLPGLILGLGLEWVSSTQIKVTRGVAHIESSDDILKLASDSTQTPTLTDSLSSAINSAVTTLPLNSTAIFPSAGRIRIDNEEIDYTGKTSTTLTGCTRGVNGTTAVTHTSSTAVGVTQWYYLYLWNNGGTVIIEVSTIAPAAPYFGYARSLSGNTAKRLVGLFRTDSAGRIFNFIHNPLSGEFNYQADFSLSPFRVLAAGQATSFTSVSAAAIVPPIADLIIARFINYGPGSPNTTVVAFVTIPSDTGVDRLVLNPNTDGPQSAAVDGSQQFSYRMNGTATGIGGLYVDVKAFFLKR